MDSPAVGKVLGRWRCALQRRGLRRPGLLLMAGSLAMLAAPAVSLADGPGRQARPLPAFHEIEPITARKERFLEYLTPMIRAENDRIRLQRSRLHQLAIARKAGQTVYGGSGFLRELARAYGIEGAALSPGELIGALLERVDVIPRSLVLAQAAKESGWGCSRFARRANNLFGQWCFDPGCGVVPRQRPAGMTHEVRSFGSVRDSVASYIRNLNTHESYRDFRRLRAELRTARRPLSGMRLAEGLTRYSARGHRYVREVQVMIRQNDLEGAEVTAVTGR